MTKRHAQKGFTLVELAISLTIIGLLIGGVLKGKQLMDNARVASAVAQVASVKAATTTFLRTYNGLPGDLKNAHTRIPKCPNCELDNVSWAGDGAVGKTDWDLRLAQGNSTVGGRPIRREENETLLFWAELAQAGLLAGVSYDGGTLTGGTAEFGVHAPEARIGGGWIVGQANGGGTGIQPLAVDYIATSLKPKGLFMVLAPSPVTPLNATQGTQVLTPLSAAAIDEKIDDGKALAGSVVAYGFNSASGTPLQGCFRALTAPESATTYNESIQSKDCGVFVQIND